MWVEHVDPNLIRFYWPATDLYILRGKLYRLNMVQISGLGQIFPPHLDNPTFAAQWYMQVGWELFVFG